MTKTLLHPQWSSRYRTLIAWVDGVAVLWAMAGALVLRFGTFEGDTLITAGGKPYVIATLFLSLVWWLMLGLWGSRDITHLGYGTEEFKRILSASFWLFGLIATFSYIFRLEVARGYVALALPAGMSVLVLGRIALRSHLRSQRRQGKNRSSVLIVGGFEGVKHLCKALTSQPMAGYSPIAAYLPTSPQNQRTTSDGLLARELDVPVVGGEATVASLMSAIHTVKPDAVALSSGVPLPPRVIRELGWALADMNIRLIMAPALTDVAGPRMHTQPVAGLPLIHVSTPNLGKGQRLLKRAFDLAGAVSLLLLLAPVLCIVALCVRVDSPGPIIFRQERVGAGGRPFFMYKFRSMVVDAERLLPDLRSQSEGNGVLFKLKADPRITKAGRFLRRFSLDELPQLFNVLNGSMSLVGPRPPLREEVDSYQTHVHRRLMVRPGLTGLWQVSGRSLLSWDDTVRLDLYYVENWSLAGDLAILLKTFRAVFSRRGAY